MRIGRRRFLRDSVALPPLIAALFAAVVTVSCQDSSDDSPTEDSTDDPAAEPAPVTPQEPAPPAGDVAGVISGNHGHSCVITQAELGAGNAVVLTLTLGSGHTHTLSLDITQVTNIAGGIEVAQTSSTDSAHSHLVTFN